MQVLQELPPSIHMILSNKSGNFYIESWENIERIIRVRVKRVIDHRSCHNGRILFW